MLLAVLALVASSASSDSATASCPATPLPEADTYVRELVAVQKQQEEALSRYTYEVTESRQELDASGKVTRERTRAYEVFHVKGRPVRRLVARDGQPLPPAERERYERRARDTAAAIGAGEQPSPGLQLSRILERYQFKAVGREAVEGRCALVFDFAPRPGDFPLQRDFLLRKLGGRIWVDEAEQALVRLDVHNTGGVRIALGLAASVSAAALHGEFVRLEPRVFVPRLLQGRAEGRKLLFLGFRLRETMEFRNYRRLEPDKDEPPLPAS
ncbi:MAG TPA: hypothetical protein VEQ10_07235 [Vicinamibacteria bacterium]|nr:hypothetical protein [Vicinamibacteria bacterium]